MTLPFRLLSYPFMVGHQMIGHSGDGHQRAHIGSHAGFAQHMKVMVQPYRVHQRGGQAPGARHDGADDRMVGAVSSVFGLCKAAVLPCQCFGQRTRVAAQSPQQDRDAHVQEQSAGLGDFGVRSIKLPCDIAHGE